MQCPNCAFENMPGMSDCVRCSAPLETPKNLTATDFMPPRAGKLKGFRSIKYFLSRIKNNCIFRITKLKNRFLGSEFPISGQDILHMILECAPGLGHFVDKRWRWGISIILIWLALGVAAINFYPSFLGAVFFGLWTSWHAFAIFHAGRVSRHFANLSTRFYVTLLNCAFCYCIYFFLVSILITPYWEFIRIDDNLPIQKINNGDTLLVTVGLSEDSELERGQMVYGENWLYGVIFGIPGDEVSISPNAIKVNGETLAPSMFFSRSLQVPPKSFSFKLKSEEFFISYPAIFNVGTTEALFKKNFISLRNELRGEITWLYLPTMRRHQLHPTFKTLSNPKDH